MPPHSTHAALANFDVSRETFAGLQILVEELARWQRIKNLVAESTIDDVWHRHVADSLQVFDLMKDAKCWLDLGSGAGFPGLVVAIAGAELGARVHLVESNSRKCAFLRHVVRLTNAPAEVHESRLESLIPTFIGKADVVSARALASLGQLLTWTEPLLTTGTTALFPKGRDADAELTEARKSWRFQLESFQSRTDSAARILRITHLAGL